MHNGAEKLIHDLNHPEVDIRLGSLCKLAAMIKSGAIPRPETGNDVNNHIHTTYSFSPYSPAKAIWMAYNAGLATAGIMDHDSISGAREFIEAGKIIGIATTIGVECRVDFSDTPLKGRRINNPDQDSIAYITLHGIPHTQISSVKDYFLPYQKHRNIRNRQMVDRINRLINKPSLTLDFDRDVVPLSNLLEGGSITERHILYALSLRLIEHYGKGQALIDFLEHELGLNINQKWRIENRQKQLEHMAYYDHLTNLPNRRLFYKLFKKEMVSMRRYGHETVLIILDIDDFKKVNDTHGHPVGDDVLRQLADLLSNNVRDSDIVSRFGGEEFVILMTHTSIDGGYTFAERLRTIIMEKKFTVGSVTIKLTCSLGICLLNDIDSRGLEDYYFLADRALYLAKQGGKNRVETACRLVQNT
jgi:diguanylate cyclase (GGDEF)-like protein